MKTFLVAAALAAGVLTGCSVAPEQPVSEPAAPSLNQAPPSEDMQPIALRIPSIGVDSRDPAWLPLGIQGDEQGNREVPVTPPGKAGEIEVPPLADPLKLGFYCPNGFPVCGAPVPGQVGPTVVVGHVNGNGKAGIFAKLVKLKPGALIQIDLKSGMTVSYKVTEVSEPLKSKFPTDKVYGDTKTPTLRLITCGGGDNALERIPGAGNSYVNQTIIYADMTELAKT